MENKNRKIEDGVKVDIKLMMFEGLKDQFGERCKDVEDDCPCCLAWKTYDEVTDGFLDN